MEIVGEDLKSLLFNVEDILLVRSKWRRLVKNDQHYSGNCERVLSLVNMDIYYSSLMVIVYADSLICIHLLLLDELGCRVVAVKASMYITS